MPIAALSALCYSVSDWEIGKKFYLETLGLPSPQFDDVAGWALLKVPGGVPIFLIRAGGPVSGSGLSATFDVTEIDAFLAHLRENRVRISDNVQEGPGGRIYSVYDPDGNLIELREA